MFKTNFLAFGLIALLYLFGCSHGSNRYPSSGKESGPSAAVLKLVEWETTANNVTTKSAAAMDVDHYEIPLKLLKSSWVKNIDKDLKDSLIFKKDGEEYVRWVLNPEDTKWYLEVEKWLVKNKIKPVKKKFFKGYFTASRSMIIYNPENKAAFSLKMSTNNTGGQWKDKKQDWEDVKQIRGISDWAREVTDKMPMKRLVIMDEPIGIGIEELDQGMIMRNLNDLPQNGHYYLPGFSAFHTEEGKRIALLNGSTNPVAYWSEHYNKPLAEGLAELAAHLGIYYDSPHSQNFLIELDAKMKPTGKIIARDFGDAYLLKEFVEKTKYKWLLDIWEKGNILSGNLHTAIGALHGNFPPPWITSRQYVAWGFDFFDAFEKKYSELTGIKLETLAQSKIGMQREWSYFSKDYPTKSSEWKRYIEYADCYNGAAQSAAGKNCEEFFKIIRSVVPTIPNLSANRVKSCVEAVGIFASKVISK
jgi:hypothetical protein